MQGIGDDVRHSAMWCVEQALLHCGIRCVKPPGVRGPGAEGPAMAAASSGADHAVVVGKDKLEAGRMTLRDTSGGWAGEPDHRGD